ncbi:MAG: hypothetical protein F4Y08_05080 [Caldilineaceae bacterium SB0662_bin_9]|uniref:Uncharacterized protein n=1 Tax=Caldilineaceae bacterium SB0662_bin_9 TaxID=2605258 RepID=A0A6B1DPQ0_9CHLR|nr:hypothetical protein [Caldilineaceae bacterium SB0662_bin_9]
METREERERKHNDWRRLVDHLSNHGLQGVPDDCLRDATSITKPNVQLVAYYAKVTLTTSGRPAFPLASVALQIFTVALVLISLVTQWNETVIPLASQMFAAAILLGGFVWFIWKASNTQNALWLTLSDLSMSLPDEWRHTAWADVYSASAHDPGCLGSLLDFLRRKSCIRVLLETGEDIVLRVPARDRDLLVEVMQALMYRNTTQTP